jgi:predicted enzyme related to lactoylglutathione lyase
MAGDLVYFVVPAADAEKAKAFYGELFGWEFTPGRVPGGFNIEGSQPPGGLFEGGEGSKPSVYFSVDDIEAGVAKVRELGGEASDPEEIGSGFMSHCRDDQGKEFNLWAPPAAGE